MEGSSDMFHVKHNHMRSIKREKLAWMVAFFSSLRRGWLRSIKPQCVLLLRECARETDWLTDQWRSSDKPLTAAATQQTSWRVILLALQWTRRKHSSELISKEVHQSDAAADDEGSWYYVEETKTTTVHLIQLVELLFKGNSTLLLLLLPPF